VRMGADRGLRMASAATEDAELDVEESDLATAASGGGMLTQALLDTDTVAESGADAHVASDTVSASSSVAEADAGAGASADAKTRISVSKAMTQQEIKAEQQKQQQEKEKQQRLEQQKQADAAKKQEAERQRQEKQQIERDKRTAEKVKKGEERREAAAIKKEQQQAERKANSEKKKEARAQRAADRKKAAAESKQKAKDKAKEKANEKKAKQMAKEKAKQKAREQAKEKAKAAREAAAQKRAAEREAKKKLAEEKKKQTQKEKNEKHEKHGKHEKKRSKRRTVKGSMKLDCERDELTGKITCDEIDPETQKKSAKLSDADDGKWRVAPQRPWPPSNLNIKSHVLVGLGGGPTNIALDKVEGGVGLPHPSPLVLTFAIGWDCSATKLVEKYKERERLDGTIYYVNSGGKAVAKLTFEKAVVAMIKWPKLAKKGKYAAREAKLTIVLQPEHTVVEKIEEAGAAPEAPDPDNDKLHMSRGKDFKIDIDDTDTSKVSGVKLPSIIMDMKRSVKYAYDPEVQKQVRRTIYKVTGVKRKQLTLYFPIDDKTAIKPFEEWKDERNARPRIGSIELEQEGDDDGALQPLVTIKFFGLFVNRIATKSKHAEVELAYDKMEIEHHSPD